MAALSRARSFVLLRNAIQVAHTRQRITPLASSCYRTLSKHASHPCVNEDAKTTLTRRSLATSPNLPTVSPVPTSTNTSVPTVSGVHGAAGADGDSTGSDLTERKGSELVLSPPALVITREYEWANIIVGFEQANRYTIRAAPGGTVVGYIAEESSMTSVVTRNVMRRRRPFTATVLDSHGNVVFTVRRPIYLVSTSLYIEDADGNPMGEVQMDWHLWRRRYSLYADKQQFAAIDSGFLAFDFDLRDVDGGKLASVNKDFTGLARELFTDAGQYVLRMDPRFGLSADGVLVRDSTTVSADGAEEQYSEEKIDLNKRAVILATAIAIDFDYFSLHSRSGMGPGFMMMPGFGGGGGAAPDAAPPVPPITPIPPVGGGTDGDAGTAMGGDSAQSAAGFDPINPESPDSFTGGDGSFESEESQSEWATFEEPDHGFDEGFQDEQTWTPDSEETMDSGFGGMSDDGGEESGLGGLMGMLRDFFEDS